MKDFPSGGFITGASFIPGESGGEFVISDDSTIRRIHKLMSDNIKSRYGLKTTKMKDELIIDGIRYKRVEEELTLEDCVKDNGYSFSFSGELGHSADRIGFCAGCYPTSVIAEKVLLYGLLQSVAYKLNGDWRCWPLGNVFGYEIARKPQTNELDVVHSGSYDDYCVRFQSKELAGQAIQIFANSKFDLKKLFQ